MLRANLYWFNVLIGITVWFGLLTDYSLLGTIGDILFPIIAMMLTIKINKVYESPNNKKRRLARILSYPTIAVGILQGIIMGLMILPPLLLATLFWGSELASQTLIQESHSPTGSRVAYVYFRPTGAYAGGSGRVFVRLRYTNFPIIERDIYELRTSHYSTEDPSDFLEWQDDDTLRIFETEDIVHIGYVKGRLSPLFAIPIQILYYLLI
jgi:hypothetical protein